MTIVVFLGSLLGLMAFGMPIAFALILSGVALMFHLDFFDAQLVAQNLLNGADNFPLMAVPFFLLAGELMNAGGLSRRIVHLAMTFFGHIRGGLGFVAIGTGLLLASLSGSAIADTAAVAALMIPMMRRYGYNLERSSGLIASAGIIAPIFPPSMSFIIYGVATNVSITKLFMAGIAPALMMAGTLFVVWSWIARKENVPVEERASWGDCFRAIVDAFWALLMPVIIIGGLRAGLFTPTETAVVAAVYALIIGLFVYRGLRVSDLPAVFIASAKTTAVVMFLVASAMFTSYMITLADLPGEIIGMLEPILDHPKLLMAAIVILLTLVGTAMDLTPTILILGPVLAPLVVKAGIDPVYFGVMFVITGAVGLLTPPVGTVLNVVCGVAGVSMQGVIRGVWPYVIAYTVLIGLFVIFPELITVPASWLH
ncbi:TRAP transporter large permease subunit [Terrihabitans rhizophilus]|jgi:tripartite ATP-independent transporter DctM subunit|uniref:TRAP transporter large permease protein n=1 Tax=Terrihabitans rhizophilus TaxID=3092662 RepID=A0ABU4RMF3_9HYPH|nr:TRAP transporter large permease subunit [Terrihabitans sp. PJ23]MDX6804910.1 TRAP transporter large permease subunit [Terrihabitans sp. PJ23]